MPRLIHTESRTEAMVAAVNHLLASAGPAAISIRSIARESGVSGSSLLHHYGSRERIVRLAALRTGSERLRIIGARILDEGPLAFLPTDLDEIVDARAWLAWLELWRSEHILTAAIHGVREDERAWLARSLDYRASRADLDALSALIDGLQVAVCAPRRPLPLPRAREILRRQVEDLLARDVS